MVHYTRFPDNTQEQVYHNLKDFAAKLRDTVDVDSGVSASAIDGSMVAEMTDVIHEIEQLYAEALVDASENYRTASETQKTSPQRVMK